MKQLTESLYAIVVPEDTRQPYITLCLDVYVLCYKSFGNEPCALHVGFKSEVLGFVSQDTITFDVEEIVESIEVSEYKYGGELHPKYLFLDYESNTYWLESYDASFRSLLTSKGINIEENIKLVIIKKL